MKFMTLYLLIISFIAHAQVQDTTVIHHVKSGDTMHSITRQYLGTDLLWQDNWKLNPHVKNPNLLTIGQELSIISERIIPAKKATMLEIVNNVEKKLVVGDWKKAQDGDKLLQQEGVRTFEGASTLLEFSETSSLKILEFSQIFLQSRKTSFSGTDSSTIEIIEGDAELKWEPLNIKQAEIEIISGKTTLIPKITTGQTTSLRTGLAENGNSIVSVYEGHSNVASAGSQVAVKKGMGVSVKQGEKPPEPKPLLKAPIISSKDVQKRYNYTNPILKWQGVEQAQSYLVEMCIDLECNKLIAQNKTITNQFQVSNVTQSGQYYWRVSAISPDEIVGFKSPTHEINFTSNKADLSGPNIAIDIIGTHSISNTSIILSTQAQLNILSVDEYSGFDKLYYRWNEEPLVYIDNFSTHIEIKEGLLSIQASDKLNNETIKTYTIKRELN